MGMDIQGTCIGHAPSFGHVSGPLDGFHAPVVGELAQGHAGKIVVLVQHPADLVVADAKFPCSHTSVVQLDGSPCFGWTGRFAYVPSYVVVGEEPGNIPASE